ncbi:MAG: nucleoside triphosphate pyrophosphatase [Pigmentiphaga sp.]|uniref:Maf family protein n=1 Tax=Pigmentiphaga sp. TaxID=1977564 RepID=UPI0029BDE681|nr:nucleoside triphosphate pyrophosphatase [Pigmentiphaga sp.]MDX3907581.1 nucleoside triphosphate pyrophosphatase [Pigmentiphaga sp.]
MTAIYLASRSPRRTELLAQLGVEHDVLLAPPAAGPDEPQLPGEPAADYVRRTAREKALLGAETMRLRHMPERPLLAADTTVILDGDVLGKPVDRADAVRILQRLSGSTHVVHTALAVVSRGVLHEDESITQVQFRELTPRDIERYCDTGEPYDKAGAYGIQGLGGIFVRHISGSFTGVMGLPLYETARLLACAGIVLP